MPETKIIPVLLLLGAFCACRNDPRESAREPRNELVRAVETAHNKTDFTARETVAFDLEVTWKNGETLNANILQRTDGARIRIQKRNGSVALFDGNERWLAAAAAEPDARFDLFAWHYFFCLPWKLSDPGTRWQELPDRMLEGVACRSGRLTFEPGTGDAPDDWYLVFSGRQDGLLRGAVYIVTYGGTDAETAGKTPQIILYGDFRPVDGITVAHAWSFYGWHTDSLGDKEAIGTAVVRNVVFSTEKPDDFAVPPGARKI